MATHSSTLAWKIPWTEKCGGLQSMGLQRVGHNWPTSLHFIFLSKFHSPSYETVPLHVSLQVPYIRYSQFLPLFPYYGFPHSSVGKESSCNAEDPSSIPGSRRSAGEGIGYPLQYSWASLVAHLVKNLPALQETWVQSLGWEDPLRDGRGYPLQYSGLENSMDWVSKNRTRLSDFHFLYYIFSFISLIHLLWQFNALLPLSTLKRCFLD